MVVERFNSLAEELDYQNNKLMNIVEKYEEARGMLQ